MRRQTSSFFPVLAVVGVVLLAEMTLSAQESISFENVSRELDFVRSGGLGGAAWLDYDSDGRLDLFLPNGQGQPNALYRNNGDGTFTDVAEAAGVTSRLGSSGVVVGDVDNDGHPDLFLAGTNGAGRRTYLRFYHNLGDGTFEDLTDASTLKGTVTSTSLALADIDHDGFLDLFVGSAGSLQTKIQDRNNLYRNNGDLTFTDISADAGVNTKLGACAGGFMDYDADGWADLFIADCNEVFFAPTPIELFHNDRDLTFTDRTRPSGLSPGGFWMGITFSDYDRDGDFDIFSTNLGATTGNRNVFYENEGDGTFRDVSIQAGVRNLPFGWGCSFADFNNDGWDDLVFVGSLTGFNGNFMGVGRGNPGTFLLNNGDRTFTNSSGLLNVDLSSDFTSGVAVADYDNNGFPDIVLIRATNGGRPGEPVLLRNRGNGSSWLTIRTIGVESNRDGVGARLRVVTGEEEQVKEVRAGSSFASMDSPWVSFGLADHETADLLEVSWPSGTVDRLENVRARQVIAVREGEGVSPVHDCNGNDTSDLLEIADGESADCNGNRNPDACDIASGRDQDCNENGIPDACEPDCDLDGTPDECEIASGETADCNENGVPDSCDVAPSNFALGDESTAAAGDRPKGIVHADIDGDGDRDLVTVNERGDDVSTLLNMGEAGFVEGTSHPVGNAPTGAAAADLDGDGDDDLVVSNGGSFGTPGITISVLISAGDGGLVEAVEYEVGRKPVAVVATDLNGDGIPDVATVNQSSDDVSVLLGEGDGRLGAETRYPVGNSPVALEAADIDGDGSLDLVALNRSDRSVTLLVGDGSGGFEPADAPLLEIGHAVRAFAATDFDGDGRVDLAVASSSSPVVEVMLRSEGSFTAPGVYEVARGTARILDLEAADVTGDGRPDLVVSFGETVAVLPNRGGSVLGLPIYFESPLSSDALTAVDLDGNGLIDLAAADSGEDQVSIRLNGSALPVSSDCNANGLPDACEIASGAETDLDQDGVPDSCQTAPFTPFRRGDANADGSVNVSDGLFVFDFLFVGEADPPCRKSADANDSGALDIVDGTYLLIFLFSNGPAPALPGAQCGDDPTPDSLDCEAFMPCR